MTGTVIRFVVPLRPDGELLCLPRLVTAIRMPEAVNAVAVGDPSRFKVEHSEREPDLVFVKALTAKPAETNLLVSTVNGQDTSLLLVSHATGANIYCVIL